MIFDRNKDRHTFYLEESYAVPWMYPFLEPYGVIFRLTTEPQAQLRAQSLAHDRAYWDALTRELLADPRFRRDDEAQRHFAKLRTAIGGLYAYRKLPQEAEYAYRQALALCPDSYEAHVRLAQLYGEQNRCAEGRQLLENYLKYDQYNIAIREMIVAFGNLQRQLAEIAQLEQLLAAEPDNLSVALQLVKAYSQRRRLDDLDSLANRLLNRLDLTPNDFLQLAQAYADVNRYDRMEQVLTLLTRRHPQSGLGWYLLAVVESLRNKCPDCVAALQRAFALDRDNQLHLSAQQDPRLNNCRTNPAFQELLPPVGAPFRLSP
jgi:predicted Zn-dependent protease